MPFDGADSIKYKTLEKLDKVIRLVDRNWCQGAYRTSDARYCLVGAMRIYRIEKELKPIILKSIVKVTGKSWRFTKNSFAWPFGRRIERFNDDSATTHDKVMQVLEDARQSVINS